MEYAGIWIFYLFLLSDESLTDKREKYIGINLDFFKFETLISFTCLIRALEEEDATNGTNIAVLETAVLYMLVG